MSAIKTCLVYLGLIALQTAYGHRVVRSPDKMEIDIPKPERESAEYQENMNKEAEYWQGQGADGHGQMDEEREKNEETYNHEMEHHYDNQQAYNKEMNQTVQSDKDKMETHHEENQAHYQDHHNNLDAQNLPDMTETETGDRYEDKGNAYKEEGEDTMYNYEPGQNSPTITYTRD